MEINFYLNRKIFNFIVFLQFIGNAQISYIFQFYFSSNCFICKNVIIYKNVTQLFPYCMFPIIHLLKNALQTISFLHTKYHQVIISFTHNHNYPTSRITRSKNSTEPNVRFLTKQNPLLSLQHLGLVIKCNCIIKNNSFLSIQRYC